MARGVGSCERFGLQRYIEVRIGGVGKWSRHSEGNRKQKLIFPFHPLGNISKRMCAVLPH